MYAHVNSFRLYCDSFSESYRFYRALIGLDILCSCNSFDQLIHIRLMGDTRVFEMMARPNFMFVR